MSDERILKAQEFLKKGEFDEVIKLLKPLLNEDPDNLEIRQILTEAQEGMMLRLQLTKKINEASQLIARGDKESALKIIDSVLHIDPTNPDAMRMKNNLDFESRKEEEATSFEDLAPFELSEQPQSSEPINLGKESESFDLSEMISLEDNTSPQELKGESNEEIPLESFGEFSFGGEEEKKEYEAIPLEEPQGDQTVLSTESESATPFSFGEGENKPENLVTEGKQLIAQGKYQEAIDVLTRVFILDEENVEAQNLIDEAKAKLQQKEQEANLILNEAISTYDSGDFEKAKEMFLKVTEIIPGHREALFYLNEIEEKKSSSSFQLETPFQTESSQVQESFSFDSSGADDLSSLVTEEKVESSPAFKVEEKPPQIEQPAPATKKKVLAKKEGKNIPYALIAIIVVGLAVVGAGFFFVPKIWNSMFSPKRVAQTIPSKPPKEKPKQAQSPTGQESPKTPANPLRSASEVLLEAKTAMQEKQYEKAINLFNEAEKLGGPTIEIRTNIENAKVLLEQQKEEEAKIQRFVTDYEKAVKFFKMAEYGEAVRICWRLIYPKEQEQFAAQMGKADQVKKIIRNGYFNWAVKDLKAGNVLVAKNNLKDLLDFDPRDSKARELLNFTTKYLNKPLDEDYQSYVQNLTYRQIEE
jgi:tetratricopeptide (TPR) repeat protein